MKKIIVMGASTSIQSINRQLAFYASTLIQNMDKRIIDINDYEMPIFSIDREKKDGYPQQAHDFLELFTTCDGVILSTAEHNRNVCAGFKNILDWASRIDINVFKTVPILLMSTSPGGFGGQNARNIAESMINMFKGKVVNTFSLPRFKDNFQEGKIVNEELNNELLQVVQAFENHIHSES